METDVGQKPDIFELIRLFYEAERFFDRPAGSYEFD
jgi:hypothetical protein